MTLLVKPDVICTHESDLDGFVSGLLLQALSEKLFGKPARLEAYHYNEWKNRELREKSAWICDLAFESRMDKPNYTIFDHHQTECVPQHAKLRHDLNKSAGLICYEACKENGIQSEALDRLVHLNDIADLFKKDEPDFLEATDYASVIKNYQFWNIHSLLGGKLEPLLNHDLIKVMKVKREIEDPIGLEWAKNRVRKISDKVGYVECIIGNSNLIVHHLLDSRATPYQVLVTLNRKSNGMVVVSLRSDNGEALTYARHLQGGGHANASGATLPRSIKNIPDAISYLTQLFDPNASSEHFERMSELSLD
jgi:oligoribonuclease NrnB/cAMP/cGMP phosphodiesterase (DHH superfamily)